MDYEKKYNEALAWMRGVYPTLTGAVKEDAEHYFPELRESEDERIRKWILEKVQGYADSAIPCPDEIQMANKALSWLEEQKDKNCLACDQHLKGYIAGRKVTEEEKQKEQKPAEWSEEDEEIIKSILFVLESYVSKAECEQNPSLTATYPTYYKEIDWLKSLRPQPKRDCKDCAMFLNGKCTKPHWKPSEEQMNLLLNIEGILRERLQYVKAIQLAELYEQLKKLM